MLDKYSGKLNKKQAMIIEKAIAIAIAILLWQIIATALDKKILLATPVATLSALLKGCQSAVFYMTILNSFWHIVVGFLLGAAVGAALAIVAGKWRVVEIIIWPYISLMKVTPVASFIILCLIWLTSTNISIFISFITVMPIIYTNLLSGIKQLDKNMNEMADLYKIHGVRRFLFIYIEQLKGFIFAGLELGIGMAFKSGVAAEVIGVPRETIGKMIYEAKIYLETPELFAWTFVIIVVSILFEKLFTGCIKLMFRKMEGLLWR